VPTAAMPAAPDVAVPTITVQMVIPAPEATTPEGEPISRIRVQAKQLPITTGVKKLLFTANCTRCKETAFNIHTAEESPGGIRYLTYECTNCHFFSC
jgi:hypothetical protein